MYPEIATFAAIQDWDAIFHFEFGPYGDTNKFVNAPPSNDVINGFFSDNSDPVREGFIPEAALIFRSGAIAPASTVATLHLSPAMSFAAERASSVWQDCIKDFASNLLSQRFETTLDPAVSASRVTVAGVGRNSQSAARVVSTPAGTQYLASSDRVVAAAGYVGGQTLKLGNVALAFPQFGNNFASLAITPLDGVSIGRSKRLLLTIGGKAENTGVVWNSARNHPTEWGHAPVLAEGIPACVMIGNAFITHVWALDTTGARSKELPVSIEGGKVTFNIGPEYQTIWYELAK
jgi:hypothetical protein